jgi:UDP:flavonoid glycosyltransferase YjiC (YdhE family)
VGAWTKVHGIPPKWPAIPGKRIYAYLKPFSGLAHLLSLLRELEHSTLVCCDGIDVPTQQRFASRNLRFENDRLDMEMVARECDLGVLNGNHGTTVALLMAAKPSFHVPITFEQALLGDAVRRTGAGLAASAIRPGEVRERLRRMLNDDGYARAAARFRQRHADFDANEQQLKIITRIEKLAQCRA